MNRDAWIKKLDEAEKSLGLGRGYKFVYGPWSTLRGKKFAFLSLNPGRAPENADMRTISDERGNSYEVEKHNTKSKITKQFLRLANFLNCEPIDILTGAAVPFRSNNWQGLSKNQKKELLNLGKEFWQKPLSQPSIKTIIACSNDAGKFVTSILGSPSPIVLPSNWGKTKIRRYDSKEKTIIHLPHLSRFQLMGRPDSEQAIRSLMGGR